MKFKHFTKVLFLLAVVFSWLVPTNNAEAVPAFARQMGTPCLSCHFQHFPKLNSFGREFRLGGYTQTAQELIEDDGVSIPPVANIGFFLEYKYQKTDTKGATGTKTGTDRGQWDLYDEAAIFFAGRMGENFGLFTELAEGVENAKIVYSKSFGSVQGGLSAYVTHSMGPAFGMELFNTGVQMHIVSGVNMMVQSASLSTMVSMGEATGFTAFVGGNNFFAAYGLWSPFGNDEERDTGFDMSSYYRFAFTKDVAGFNSMIGLFGRAGETKCSEACSGVAGTVAEVKTEAMGIDLQAQGDIGSKTLGIYADYVFDTGDDLDNQYNMGPMMMVEQKNNTAFSVMAQLGINNSMGVRAGFLSHSWKNQSGTAKSYTSTTLGGYYLFAQNIQLAFDYNTFGGDVDDIVSMPTMPHPAKGLNNLMALALKVGF